MGGGVQNSGGNSGGVGGVVFVVKKRIFRGGGWGGLHEIPSMVGVWGLTHDVGVQLRNKNGLTLDFLLFLVILKASGRKASRNQTSIYVHPKERNFLSERDLLEEQ